MGNINQEFKPGTPSISIRWPKDAVIKAETLRNNDGRFICRIKVNDSEFFNLPGSYPTESDAKLTLESYLTENTYSCF